jgi:hypothetical protein
MHKNWAVYQPQQRRIFVSHCARSKLMAREFQRLVKKHQFRNVGEAPTPNVFLSSDPDSIASGEPWLDAVLRNLDSCTDFVALITDPDDWKSQWIPFEVAYFMGRQRGLGQHGEKLKLSEKRPPIFVLPELMKDVPWPLCALHLIDTSDLDRVQDAVLAMEVGPWLCECIQD